MKPAARIHALDSLRALMMWLGIVLHVAILHTVGKTSVPWRDPHTTPAADFTVTFIHSFRMPVFFILAGFFVMLLLARNGIPGMLKNRLLRLVLPFVLFWPLVYVVLGGLTGQYFGLMEIEPADLRAFEAERPMLHTAHLWFLYFLIWFCAAAALAAMLAPRLPASLRDAAARVWLALGARWWGVLVLTLPLAATGAFYPDGVVVPNGSFLPPVAELVHNGLYFIFGCYLHRHREILLPLYAQNCWRLLGAGAVFFAAALPLFALLAQKSALFAWLPAAIAFFYHGASWLWSLALIGLFLRYLPAHNRVLAFLSDSSYWVYLVHLPIIVGFGVLLYETSHGAFMRMAINLAATTAICLLSYLLLVRYTPIGAMLNGNRRPVPLSLRTLGVSGAALFAIGIGCTQIKFDANSSPTTTMPPAAVAVPADVGQFLRELGNAYGSADGAAVGQFLAQDFLHQGMDRAAFLHHLRQHRRYLGKLDITPVGWKPHAGEPELDAWARSERGVLAPSLQLLPLQAGATLVREDGKWKLRGNREYEEVSQYRQATGIIADFAPADLEAYKRFLPAGYTMPDTPYVRVSVTDWQRVSAPNQPYRLAQLSILASKDGEKIWHLLAMPETDWLAVEAGKAIGFPKFVADIDIRRSLGNQWQVALRHDGKPLAEIAFDAVITTKTSRYAEDLPQTPEEWLLLGPDGTPTKAAFRALQPPRKLQREFGWMTVTPQAPQWQALLAPGSRALAQSLQFDGAFKLHIMPVATAAVPQGVQQLLDATATAWAAHDMDAVMALHHSAFSVTNQKDLTAMRRLFSYGRRYEWRVHDYREEGDFAYIGGEIVTEDGTQPAQRRLLREGDRWRFYADYGSWHERRHVRLAEDAAGTHDIPDEFLQQVQQLLARPDDLKFSGELDALDSLSSLANRPFKPAGAGPFPALVLLPDCGGIIGKTMRRRVEDAIAQGYVVMVVDSMRGHANNCVLPLRVPMERRIKDAYDALAHLRTLPQVDPQRIAVAGYSQGGTIALLLASPKVSALFTRTPRFAAATAWYPLCYMSARYAEREADFLRADIDTPLQLLMGGEDIYTPAYDCVPHLESLQARGVPVEWQVYPKAVHGWDLKEFSGGATRTFRGDRMIFAYDADATREAQKQMFDFLQRRLQQQPARVAGSPSQQQ